MYKTFTYLLLFCAIFMLSPKLTVANSSMELAFTDARFGDKEIIKLYPNPMITDATIKISEDINLDNQKVSIVFYNMVGSEVYKVSQIKNYEQKITKESFKNSGIYFYQLIVDNKIASTGRITVK
ncbi:MAG: T9SS type A sorting domain-containing protein [Chitinophagales bacterium]|nr:T9SS type A sorting domain-containing protein [Bacteroidota bacterium]